MNDCGLEAVVCFGSTVKSEFVFMPMERIAYIHIESLLDKEGTVFGGDKKVI